jgi:hypothetical protein
MAEARDSADFEPEPPLHGNRPTAPVLKLHAIRGCPTRGTRQVGGRSGVQRSGRSASSSSSVVASRTPRQDVREVLGRLDGIRDRGPDERVEACMFPPARGWPKNMNVFRLCGAPHRRNYVGVDYRSDLRLQRDLRFRVLKVAV